MNLGIKSSNSKHSVVPILFHFMGFMGGDKPFLCVHCYVQIIPFEFSGLGFRPMNRNRPKIIKAR